MRKNEHCKVVTRPVFYIYFFLYKEFSFDTFRLVSSSSRSQSTSPAGLRDFLTFHIRIGTPSGVVNVIFRTETQKDLAGWARNIVVSSHEAANSQKEISCSKISHLNNFVSCAVRIFLLRTRIVQLITLVNITSFFGKEFTICHPLIEEFWSKMKSKQSCSKNTRGTKKSFDLYFFSSCC